MLVAHGRRRSSGTSTGPRARAVAERARRPRGRLARAGAGVRRRDHRHARARRCSSPPARCATGQHVSLMGADGPGKAEVAVEELARGRLFCDDWEQASHGGELTGGGRGRRVSPASDVTELGRRARRRRRGPARATRRSTLFDSTGLAIQDLAIASAGVSQAAELDLPRLAALSAELVADSRADRGRTAAGAAVRRGLEQVEQRVAVAEERARDEVGRRRSRARCRGRSTRRPPRRAPVRAPGRRRAGSPARDRRSRPSGSRRAARARRARRRSVESASGRRRSPPPRR